MRRPLILATAATGVLAAGLLGVALVGSDVVPSPLSGAASCVFTAGTSTYEVDPEQAEHAATIAAVASSRDLPNHAVTVALATVMQESRLYNLDYGDRDSLGLFQQRPSQGWGSPEEVQDPVYAATRFFRELENVSDWEARPVTEAAQAVQRSGFPNAYAQWEDEARVMARVLTGEVAAGLTCDGPVTPVDGVSVATVVEQAQAQLDGPVLERRVGAARGWETAAWLVAHSGRLGIDQVGYAGRTWSPGDGWTGTPDEGRTVTFRLAGGSTAA